MRQISISAMILVLLQFNLAAVETQAPKTPAKLDEIYQNYNPGYLSALYAEGMKFSVQPTFYNKSAITKDTRVEALIREGIKSESAGAYSEAMKHYQAVLVKYPDSLIQLSEYGVFGPAAL